VRGCERALARIDDGARARDLRRILERGRDRVLQ
jgi:hypothetical protein